MLPASKNNSKMSCKRFFVVVKAKLDNMEIDSP